MVHQGQEYLIHGLGRLRNAEDLEQAWVTTRGGQPVRLRDVAEVRVGPALKRGEGSHDGKPAVILGIQKQPGPTRWT
jgi:Cu/Ag efflux pump CusA